MRTTAATLTVLAAAAAALTGGSAVEDALSLCSASSYEDLAAFEKDAGVEVPWLPADATAIELTRSTQARDAAIAVHSSADLSAELCAEVPRQSAPAYQPGEPVDVYKISAAFACGDWTVVATEDGWLGWTPGHPDEKAQSPS